MRKRRFKTKIIRLLVVTCMLPLASLFCFGQEICDDGVDNDQDGFIDYFDEECPCLDTLFQAQCSNPCEQSSSDTTLEVSQKWMSEILNDSIARDSRNMLVDSDGIIYSIYSTRYLDSIISKIILVEGATGILLDSIIIDTSQYRTFTTLAIFRDRNSQGKRLIFQKFNGDIICMTTLGDVVWQNSDFKGEFNRFRYPKIADIDEDGNPEVYSGNVVLNGQTGVTIFAGSGSEGCNFWGPIENCSIGGNSTFADLTSHPGLELAAGNNIYEITLVNKNDSVGNTANVIVAPNEINEGHASIADIDNDGMLDVVINRSNEASDGGVWVWNPRSNGVIASITFPAENGGGLPTLVDLDNDCRPEIIIAFRNRFRIYSYNGSSALEPWYIALTSDESGQNGIAAFDLNADGQIELIYRDETDLRIFDAVSGTELFSMPLFSGTLWEKPIISDIDNDGAAEMIIQGGLNSKNELRMFCFESANTPWAPARRVWNQTGYHVTNVNDDLTIPQYQQNTAAFFDTDSCFVETCPQVYNTFGVQATYRTQKGCQVYEDDNCIDDEICDDGIDNDQDGFIDYYDKDCMCDDDLFNAQCPSTCENLPDSFPHVKLQLKWLSEPTSNVITIPNILVDPLSTNIITVAAFKFGDSTYNGTIRLDANTGDTTQFIFASTSPITGLGDAMIADLFNDGETQVVKNSTELGLTCMTLSGNITWSNNHNQFDFKNTRYPKAIDFNQDGLAEIYVGNKVLNGQSGRLIYNGQGSAGCNFLSLTDLCNAGAHSIAGNFTDHPGIELAVGNQLLEIDFNTLNDTVGNTVNIITAPEPVMDGYTSMGDIDGDGFLDIIVVRSNLNSDGGVWVWNPRTESIVASTNSKNRGGIATIADLDSDCIPELLVAFDQEIIVYRYDGSSNLKVLQTFPTTDLSGGTGITVFDLNNDNYLEVIYRDQDRLHIVNGITGQIYDTYPVLSGTGTESPVIADINGDGNAEILVSGYVSDQDTSRVFCFESANTPWAPARRVWNQTGYHVTNVNDDLTIPQFQQNTAAFFDTDSCFVETCPQVYNTFGVQATYRTQKGCQVYEDDNCIDDEICDDGIDNDQDGFIDYYDKDCMCDDELFNAQCDQECIDTSFQSINMKLKWKTVVLNKNSEYTPFSFAVFNNSAYLQNHTEIPEGIQNKISKIDLTSSQASDYILLDTIAGDIAVEFLLVQGSVPEGPDIIIKNLDQELLRLSQSAIEWKLEGVSDGFYKVKYLKSADLNIDGQPEIYTGNSIVSNNGQLLYKGTSSEGCNFVNGFDLCSLGASSIAADFTSHSGLELACGNVVYEITLNNLLDSVGNTANMITAPPEVLEGFTGMGDFDGDGQLEVVSSRGNGNNDGGVWIWNPRNQTVIAASLHTPSVGGWGGLPTIADVNNDCVPEILVIYEDVLKVYSYDGTTDLKILHERPIIDQSGYTIPSVFDLNSDGTNEIIYRDEEHLFILDGPSGLTLDSFPLMSPTANEQPIITDGDGDGHAEILIQGSDDHPDSLRLFCFESANTPWAPARRVWNQTGYHVTNVNDDLTIPQFQQNSAAFFDTDSCLVETCPQVYNTFGIQATYRTQNGCRVYPDGGVDLQVVADYKCVGDSIEICLHAISTDTSVVRAGVNVSFYASATSGPAPLIHQSLVTEDTTCITYAYPVGIDSIFIVINDEGGFYPPSLPNTNILECDYENNIFVLPIDRPDLSLDLGPDITRCASEPVVINAQGGFETYLWTDFTTDNTYTAADDGIHYVEATDVCGRVYRDTVIITTDTLNQLSVSATPSIVCPADTFLLEASFIADSIVWYMDDVEIACINCPGIQVAIDSATTFYAVAIKDGCLSTDSITVLVQEPYTDSLSLTICESDTIVIYDLELTEAGMYEYKVGSCDTTIQIEVTVEPIAFETLLDTICSGDSLQVEDTWYAESGIYTIDLLAANGCDSQLTLELLVIDSILAQEQLQLCEGDSVMIDGVVYYAATSFEIAGTSAAGCDSVTMVDISIVEELSDTTYTSICEGDSVQIFGAWEDEAGQYSMTLPTSGGCDSSHIVVLSTISIDTTYASSTICEGDTLFINGEAYTLAGQYPTTYTSQDGCDSVAVTDLMLDTIAYVSVPVNLCAGDTLFTTMDTITAAGTYEAILQTSTGCDSIVTYEVNITDWHASQVLYELCAGDSILIAGTYYSTPVQFTDTVAGSTCDTVVSYTLSVTDPDTTYLSFAMTANESIEVGATTYDEAGDYVQVESNLSGCDSVLIITITDTDSQEQVFPNIFSPNGDNINDLWQLDLSEYPQNNLSIYDRWGNKMASWTNTPSASWDGTLSGRPVADGVYVFVLTYVDEAGLSVMRSGDVTVVR